MKSILEIILMVAMAATAIVLIAGIIELFRGNNKTDDANAEDSPNTVNKGASNESNRLMNMRVICQAVALGVLALLFLMR